MVGFDNVSGPFGCVYRDEDTVEEMTNREKLNEQKRAYMSAVIKALTDKGWTPIQIAAYAGIKTATIYACMAGKSIRNNDHRGALTELLAHDPARVLVTERLRVLEKTIEEETTKARAAGISGVALDHASERMVLARKWRDTLLERLK